MARLELGNGAWIPVYRSRAGQCLPLVRPRLFHDLWKPLNPLDAPKPDMTSSLRGVFVGMPEPARNIYAFSVPLPFGGAVGLDDFEGRVLLVVNTASKCGFTPQYAGLEQIYRTYKDRGLMVLGFPCNQFGKQEPGTATEISTFCEKNYGVSFPVFAKIDVNGPNAHPLYQYLKTSKPRIFGTQRIKWNFTKFLVNRSGKVVSRHAPRTEPKALSSEIEKLLQQNRAE